MEFGLIGTVAVDRITVFLADDNVLVREGVRALLNLEADLDVVGVAEDYDELVAGADEASPQVVVTDIRMPPSFQDEGIEAAKEVRKRHPGTGVVILSQYDDPEYAISLLSEGAAGYAYLLKDRVSDGNSLARAIREVATGGSMLDPEIVQALVAPARDEGELTPDQDELLRQVAEGRPVKAIATARNTTPEAINDAIETVFLDLAHGASAGREGALRRLRLLQKAIVEREEQGETLSRLLPGGVAERLRDDRDAIGRTERLVVTVLMSDVRGYSGIAERSDPTVLAGQLNQHRSEMNSAILDLGGTVMQYVGDAVMAVFGAPFPQEDHAGPGSPFGDRDASTPGGSRPGLGVRRARAVRTRHRPVDRRGRGGDARERGATRVHARRRHREHGATTPGSRPAGGNDGHQRADGQGAVRRLVDAQARGATGEGTGGSRRGVRARYELRRNVMEPVLTVRSARKTFEAELAPVRALRGVDLELGDGEFVAIMGPSGCGKSTLLNLVAGLDTADDGEIVLAGEPVTGKSEDELARMRRRHIGIVFQFFNLLEGHDGARERRAPGDDRRHEAQAGRDAGP